MNEQARQALRGVVARHGTSIVEDRRRCEALMRDNFGEHRREVSALDAALAERVPQDLLAAPAGTPREVIFSRLARRLTDHLALADDAARWAVNSWALALGLVNEAELADIERRPAALPSTAPQDTAHAAASSPVAASAAAATSAASSSAAPSLVVSTQGGDYASIAEAVAHAAQGARIVVRPGTYEESITIDREVEVVGDGPADQIVVRSDGASCLVVRAERARVAGLTLRGEAAGGGEGFFAVDIERGKLVLEDCDISSRTLSCVAVHGEGAAPLLRRCRVHDGADSGLYIFDGAAAMLEDCEVYANRNVGVAVTAGASFVAVRTRIHDGGNAGLVVWGEGADASLEGCEVYANRLTGLGASDEGRLRARACRVRGGHNTGVFVHRRGDATLEDCEIEGHPETEVAVETEGQLSAVGCRVRRSRGNGFFVRDGGQALIQECDVSENAAHGVAVAAGSLAVVVDCRVNANAGAGLKLEEGAAARVNGSDLAGNQRGAWDVEDGAHLEGTMNAE